MKWEKGAVAACAGVIGFSLVYLAVDYLRLPRLVYEPLARELTLTDALPGPMSMGYLGLWIWGLLGGAAAAGAGWGAVALRRRPLSEQTLGLLCAWAATAFVVAGAYHAWHNWP